MRSIRSDLRRLWRELCASPFSGDAQELKLELTRVWAEEASAIAAKRSRPPAFSRGGHFVTHGVTP